MKIHYNPLVHSIHNRVEKDSLHFQNHFEQPNFNMNAMHTASTFGRTIFSGVWDVSVMRHGSQASDEIEDDLYQYNVK